MAKTSQDATVYRKNKVTLRFTVLNQDIAGEPVLNITGHTLKYAVARLGASGDPITGSPVIDLSSATSAKVVLTDATNGKVEVRLEEEDTDLLPPGEYYQELEDFDASGDAVVAATGTLTVLPNVENV